MASHAVFHATTTSHLFISHNTTATNISSSSSSSSSSAPSFLPPLPSPFGGHRKFSRGLKNNGGGGAPLIVRASAAPASVDPRESLERCFLASDLQKTEGAVSTRTGSCSLPTMKGEYGAFGTVTLEKSKLDMSSKTMRTSPETAIGGGGGDIGKKNFHGGGDGGDDGGDDDDYFGDFDEWEEGDDGGLFRRRIVLGELFDKKFVDAVLQEWYKTMSNLPAGLRQAYEMGLLSSAQMVRFLSIEARPTTVRALARSLPQSLSRAFIGRMLADPSFLYKLLLEQATTIGCTAWWEIKTRKERIRQEWDLALINIMTVSVCNAVVVWSLAPCRSYGNTFRFDLQNTLQKLPNNIFEKSYPMREFDMQKRVQSFFYKAAEFCLVGSIGGMIQGALSKVSSSKKKDRLSVSIPTVSSNCLGYGAFLGLYANLRYQLLCGVDRAMFYHFDVIGVGIVFSTMLRTLNVQLGETSRLVWLGVEADPLLQSNNLMKAYNRPSVSPDQTANWVMSKNAIISSLEKLGFKQGTGDSERTPRPRRKRVVKKKMGSATS